MPTTIRTATPDDETALLELMPRLADFDVPTGRDPTDLWFGDSKLMQKVLAGNADNSHVLVAADAKNNAIALAMYTIKPELLSSAPSAHLEALAVHPDHLRQGLAKKLINECTNESRKKGAECMSLHVFGNNTRARALYKECGFDEELIRCYKPL